MLISLSTNREIPGDDFKAPLHLKNKIGDVGDHTKSTSIFQSPFMAGRLPISP
jgi:hypothetical protein